MGLKKPTHLNEATLNGQTVLVCGGAGFIGSNFIRRILARYPKMSVVCLDSLTYAGNLDNIKGFPKNKFTFVKGDITDRALVTKIFKKHNPSFVINFAAESHVDRSIHGGARDFMRTNVEGATVLFGAAAAMPTLKKFVHVSTDEVYGALSLKRGTSFTEDSPLRPNSPYAASKAASDLVARSFFKTFNLPVVITRCSNNYGPYQHPEKLIPYSVSRLLKGLPITIYGDGLYIRDWIHVEDHCDALELALLKGEPGEVYNIGADDEVNNLALARRLLTYFKKDESSIEYVKDRPGHDRRYSINATKIRRKLGWKPQHSFATSFAPTIAWYVTNRDWVARALKRSGKANIHI